MAEEGYSSGQYGDQQIDTTHDGTGGGGLVTTTYNPHAETNPPTLTINVSAGDFVNGTGSPGDDVYIPANIFDGLYYRGANLLFTSESIINSLQAIDPVKYTFWNQTTGTGKYVARNWRSGFSILNDTQIRVNQPPRIYNIEDDVFEFPETMNNLDFTLTYQTQTLNPVTSTIYLGSYADITVANLKSYSGDVHRVRVSTKREDQQSEDYTEIGNFTLLERDELVDTTNPVGRPRIGLFYSQSVVDKNWVSSSNCSEPIETNNTKLINGVLLSGSNYSKDEFFDFKTLRYIPFRKGEDYIVNFKGYYLKKPKVQSDGTIAEQARIEVLLSGSINSPIHEDFSLGNISDFGQYQSTALQNSEGLIPNLYNYFTTHTALGNAPSASLVFRVHSGQFHITDVTIRPNSLANFHPNYYSVKLPMPSDARREQRYDFKLEYFDFNNNKANFETYTSESIYFVGTNDVIDGLDNYLEGAMLWGNAMEVYGISGNSAYMRSVGYNGFDKTRDGTGERNGGFMIWSGSIGTRITASEAYNGVGIEVLDASDANSYNHSFLQFASNYKNTGQSRFRVQTKEFLLGLSGSGGTETYISGSNGNLEISSSNFLLSRDGSVIMQGTITAEAGGTIGGFTIGSDNLTATDFILNTTDKRLTLGNSNDIFIADADYGIQLGHATFASAPFSVTPTGALKAELGTIGGFTITSTELYSLDSGTPDSSPNNGITIDTTGGSNSKPVIRVFDGTTENAALGNFATNKFGIKAIEGEIGGWALSSTKLTGGNVELDSSGIIKAGSLTGLSDTVNTGFYVDNSGQILIRQGTNDFIKFSGGEIDLQTRKFELDANNLEVSSTEASMSLGEGKIRLKGGTTSFMTIGTGGNAISASVDSSDKFISIGKADFSEFDQATKGFIVGDDGGVFRFEVALDAQNYMSFDGTANTLDIKTEKFKLDTDRLDIDSDNSRISVFDDAGSPKEVVRIGEVDDLSNFGMKIFDGTGTDDSDILVEFSETENNIAGWDISTSTISKNNMIISSEGFIQSSGYSSGVIAGNGNGFILTAEGGGYLEVEKARIRGTLTTAVFEKETVNAVGGMLMVANSTVLSQSVSASDTTMSVDNVNGFVGSYSGFNSTNKQQLDNINNVTGEILLIKKVDNTGFTTEYVLVQSSSFYDKTAADAGTNPSGYLYVTRSFGGANSGDGDSSSPTKNSFATEDPAQAYTPGQVIASTGRYISGTGDSTVGTGYIFMNANPNDQYAPYIDIVERTGSKVYDMDLKVRMGDLTGLSQARLLGTNPADAGFGLYAENAFLEGGIISRYGSIGGFNMDSTDLWAGNSDKSNAGTVIVIGDSTGTPKIALGGQADSITLTTGDGVYMNGSGEFRVGDVDGNRLIFQNGNFAVTSSNFGLDAGTLHISSSNNGVVALGTGGPGSQAPTQLDDFGILLKGDGSFNLQSGTYDFIRNDGGTFSLSSRNTQISGSTTFRLHGNSTDAKIRLGTSADNITATTGTGIYIDSTGKFRAGDGTSGTNHIYFNGSNTLQIKSDAFELSSGNLTINSSTERIQLGAVSDFDPTTGTSKGIHMGLDSSDYEFFVGQEQGQYIHWDGTDLTIAGNITVTNPNSFGDANASRTGSGIQQSFAIEALGTTDLDSGKWLTANLTQSYHTTTPDGATYGHLRFWNDTGNAWDAGAWSQAVFLRNQSPVLEFDIAVNDGNPAFMIGFVTGSQTDLQTATNYLHMHEGFYFQGGDVRVYSDHDNTGPAGSSFQAEILTNTWSGGNDKFFKGRITLKPNGGADYEIYEFGDLRTPLATYATTGNATTNMRVGFCVYYDDTSDADKFVMINQLAAGRTATTNTTVISGKAVTTGQVQSTNWSTVAGSQLDLDSGTIKLGGSSDPDFSVDASGHLTAKGGGSIAGWTIGDSTLTGGDVTLTTTNGGNITLGSATTFGEPGIYMSGSGGVSFYKDQNNYFIMTGSILDFTTELMVISSSTGTGASFSDLRIDTRVPQIRLQKGEYTASSTGDIVNLDGATGLIEIYNEGTKVFESGVDATLKTGIDVRINSLPTVPAASTEVQNITQASSFKITDFLDVGRVFALGEGFIQQVTSNTPGRSTAFFSEVSPVSYVLTTPANSSIPQVFNVEKNYGSDSHAADSGKMVMQSTAFNTTINGSSGGSNIQFTSAGGSELSSSMYQFQGILTQDSTGAFRDAKACVVSIDMDTSGIDTSGGASLSEFVYLQGRRKTGTKLLTKWQIQGADGAFVTAGNITAFASSFRSVSDQRLKKDVHTISGSMNKILQLRPTEFVWIDNDKQDVGFIAQEVEEIIPEVVEITDGFIDTETGKKSHENTKTIAYTKLIPYLVDTIQQMDKRIKELEERDK